MLKEMLELQNNLQSRLGNNIPRMSIEGKTIFIKEHSIHLTQEIHELLYELPYFKPWKDYSEMTENHIDTQLEKAKEEFIDAWHFMLNIALALDLDAKEIHTRYKDKNAVNHQRQDDHYTFDKSYRELDGQLTVNKEV